MFAIRPTAQTEPESFILKGISVVVNQHKKKCMKFDCAVVCFVSYLNLKGPLFMANPFWNWSKQI